MIVLSELSESNKYKLLNFLTKNFDPASPSFFNPHPFTLDTINDILATKEKDIYILMLEGDAVVAYGMLRGMDEDYDIPSLGILIDKDYRGKGLGKRMMSVLHYIAKNSGYKKIRLTVHQDNHVAKNLYNSLGYIFTPFDDHPAFVGILDLEEL